METSATAMRGTTMYIMHENLIRNLFAEICSARFGIMFLLCRKDRLLKGSIERLEDRLRKFMRNAASDPVVRYGSRSTPICRFHSVSGPCDRLKTELE
jgi:hypothetical protein